MKLPVKIRTSINEMLTERTIKDIGADHDDVAVCITRICDYTNQLEKECAVRNAPRRYIFDDAVSAIKAENRFKLELVGAVASVSVESHAHVGEGGATTAYYQYAKLVGVSTRLHERNRTILICIDLRYANL